MTGQRLLLCFISIMSTLAFAQLPDKSMPLAHSETSFDLALTAPIVAVAPLFGAEKERVWAGPSWEPHFLYPNPARDQKGAVFIIQHKKVAATWICTALNLAAGHIQYTYVIPEIMVTLIDIQLKQRDENATIAHVIYERTALTLEGNDHVNHFAQSDQKAGPEWQKAINDYLKSQPSR